MKRERQRMSIVIFNLNGAMKPCEERSVRALGVLRPILRLRQRRPKTSRDNVNYPPIGP